ncbi:MAG: hypothetical protein JWN44_5195 [Myxococcales bacterium]|nr:hypothetical protein [Myxococcales bacterium]
MKNVFLSMVVLASLSGAAQAQTYVSRSMSGFPGKDEISTQLGFQASLGGTTPGGFKLFLDYSHRLTNLVWLNFKLNPTFGVGSARGVCYDRFGNAYDCGIGFDGNGYAIDLLGGVKLKWLTRYHLMPYADIDGGVVPVFSRPGNDNGAAVVLYTGGGLKYFVTPRVALGGEVNFTFGPGFYSGHTEFYRAFNMGIGAEFIL